MMNLAFKAMWDLGLKKPCVDHSIAVFHMWLPFMISAEAFYAQKTKMYRKKMILNFMHKYCFS